MITNGAIGRPVAEYKLRQALMQMGLSFAECSDMVRYNESAETAYWMYNQAIGKEHIAVGPAIASLGVSEIEMVLRHEFLHRSTYHGFGERYPNAELANIVQDVCINRLLYEAYPEKMMSLCVRFYPQESKSTVIALADCSAEPSVLPDRIRKLWETMWVKQPNGGYASINPASLYYRLLGLGVIPRPGPFMDFDSMDLPELPDARTSDSIGTATEDMNRRLPPGSKTDIDIFSVSPISIGTSSVEIFLKKIMVRRIANELAANITDTWKDEVQVDPYPLFPSRRGFIYQSLGVSRQLCRYWNLKPAEHNARMAIGIYLDVSGSMQDHFGLISHFVSAVKEYPLRLKVFDDTVRDAVIEDMTAGKITGGGWTDFNPPVLDFVEDAEIEAGILFTDGEADLSPEVGEKLTQSRKRLFVVYFVASARDALNSALNNYATDSMSVLVS
jgi:hypothetical protein